MSLSRPWWCALVLAMGVGCHHDTDRGANAPSAYAEPHTQPFPAEPQAEGAATNDNDDQAVAPDTTENTGSANEQGSGSAITSQRETPIGSGSGSGSAQRHPLPDTDTNIDPDMNDGD